MTGKPDDWFDQNPFEHTLIKPRLGQPAAGKPTQAGQSATRTPLQAAKLFWDQLNWPRLGSPNYPSVNPLLDAATTLLRMAPALGQRHFEVDDLSRQLSLGLQDFEMKALQAGCDKVEVEASRYVLCTMMDEFAGNTPWGGRGLWASHSLLLIHFRETWGGEKVFQLLGRFQQDPKRFIQSLELIYTCMALGFKGKFHIQQEGHLAHQALKTQLYAQIRATRDTPADDLCSRWASTATGKNQTWWSMPLWFLPAVACVLLGLAYAALHTSLNRQAEPVYQAILALQMPAPKAMTPNPLGNTSHWVPTLKAELANDVQAGRVSLREENGKVWVQLLGDTLFDSGKAELNGQGQPLLQRVAAAVAKLEPTQSLALRAVGHTDSQAIRTARFPSNWHLSVARAQTVGLLLQSTLTKHVVNTEGMGDGQPIADNSKPEGRAKNRRVDIEIQPATLGAAPAAAPMAGQGVQP